jgi:hypothetical protein
MVLGLTIFGQKAFGRKNSVKWFFGNLIQNRGQKTFPRFLVNFTKIITPKNLTERFLTKTPFDRTPFDRKVRDFAERRLTERSFYQKR